MSFRWRRFMTSLGFIGCLAMMVSGCVVHARARVKPVYVANEAPPAPRYRTDVRARAGYVWIRGHWQWVGSRWVWQDGHWEVARAGYQWEEGRWERRGNRYHWVEGQWIAMGGAPAPTGPVVRDHRRPTYSEPAPRERPAPAAPVVRDHRHPSSAPPPLRAESPGARAGYVWIRGRWDWRGGDWAWVAGHWERERSGYMWEAGRWELRGNHYVWVEGRWIQGGGGPRVRDHRRGPAPQSGRKRHQVPVRSGGN